MEEQKLKELVGNYFDQSIESSGVFATNNQEAKQDYINGIISNSMAKELLETVKKYAKPGDKILEAGCGLGGFLLVSQSENFDVIGIDIDQQALSIAKARLKNSNRARSADGQNLPFPNQTFDLVASQFVIEHVKNPKKYLAEIQRVLKPEGKLILYAPNFLFPWEGHYKIFWLPYLLPASKKLLKCYLKIIGRKNEFLDFINLKITPGYLKKILNQNNLEISENLSISRFKKIIDQPEKLNYPRIKKILMKIKNNFLTNFLLNFFLWALKITRLYHPIIVISEKKAI